MTIIFPMNGKKSKEFPQIKFPFEYTKILYNNDLIDVQVKCGALNRICLFVMLDIKHAIHTTESVHVGVQIFTKETNIDEFRNMLGSIYSIVKHVLLRFCL